MWLTLLSLVVLLGTVLAQNDPSVPRSWNKTDYTVKCRLHGWCYNHDNIDDYCDESCKGRDRDTQCFRAGAWRCWGRDGNCYANPRESYYCPKCYGKCYPNAGG
ncbi:hypothetical protein HDE_11885 [Halotydeus destructor]|nr:hypothetical protein HDE_11885 [Halotydeus destructor]